MVCCDLKSSPDLILFNGSIITCREEEDKSVTALAVTKGYISAIGSDSDILSTAKADYTRAIDLKKNCIVPGFIDSHSYFGKSMALRSLVDVSSCNSFLQVVEAIKNRVGSMDIKQDQIIMARGYDHSEINLPSGEKYVTCKDLDAEFPDLAVGLFHFSLQGAILNSKALEILNITKDTHVPEGGSITRNSHGELTGGIWNAALNSYSASMLQHIVSDMSADQRKKFIHEAQLDYATYGYTTVQAGGSDLEFCHWLLESAKDKRIFLDLIALPKADSLDSALSDLKFNTYFQKVKFGGIEFSLDGPVYSGHGLLGRPYHDGSNGVLKMAIPKYNELVRTVVGKGLQCFSNCHGDEAIDAYLTALEMAGVKKDNNTRHVLLNPTILREDQISVMKKYNMIPSFLTNDLLIHGDSIVNKVGYNRSDFIMPMRKCKNEDLVFTNHSDYILSPLNPMNLLATSVCRSSRSGKKVGVDQSVDVITALKALTINGAKQYHEEGVKGSIDIGKLADLVVLSKDPTNVPPERISSIKVQMTFKDGVEVFNRKNLSTEQNTMIHKTRVFTSNAGRNAKVY